MLADGKRTGVDETLWDADGNVVSQSSFDWQYDDAGRLIQEIASSTDFEDYTLTWQYDRTGNRLQQIKTPVNSDIESTIYTYDANDRLSTETKTVGSVQTTTTYTFDNTQQTSKVITTNGQSTTYNYQYDLQGRMSAVITDKPGESSTKVTYQYDSNGNRVATEEFVDANGNGTFEASEIVKRTEYLTDSENHTGYSQVLQETEFDANGVAVKKTIYSVGHDQISQTVFNRVDTNGDGTPDAWDSGQTDYFGTDGHGSVRVLYDLAAAIVQDVQNNLPQIYHFDAYGNLLNFDTATPLTSYLYSGEAFDFNIGQQYLRARWYDATNGRFNRLDPYFGNSSDPQSFHKYAYVHGDPISYVDPTGKFIGVILGTTAQLLLPGPSDFIIGGLQALLQAYVTNLEWDLEWAFDFEMPDDWGSRSDNLWVTSALAGGIKDAFWIGIPFTDIGFNPLDSFAMKIRGPSGGVSKVFFRGAHQAKHAFSSMVEYVGRGGKKLKSRVSFYYHGKLNQHIVRFPNGVIAKRVKIKANGPSKYGKRWEDLTEDQKGALRKKDIADATRKLKQQNGGKLPRGYEESGQNIVINGVSHTWHHGTKKGRMELVPTDLHNKSQIGPKKGGNGALHIGMALWWKRLR